MTYCSCLGMFHYGMMIENTILIFLNAVGACLQSSYVILYLLVARPKVLAVVIFYNCDYDSVNDTLCVTALLFEVIIA